MILYIEEKLSNYGRSGIQFTYNTSPWLNCRFLDLEFAVGGSQPKLLCEESIVVRY